MTQYFYIVNETNPDFAVTWTYAGGATPLLQKQTGPFGQVINQMWEFTQSGHIRSAANTAQVLTYDLTQQTVIAADYQPGNDYQRWQQSYWSAASNASQGTFINVGNGQALQTYGQQSAGYNVYLVTGPLGGWNQNTCLWQVIANPAPIDQSSTLRSSIVNSATSAADLALSIPMPAMTTQPPYPCAMPATGTAMVADTVREFGHNAIWQFNSDGCLVSALNSNLALSAGPDNTVVIYILQPDAQPFQTWWITNDGAIVNGLTVSGSLMALTIATDGNGQAASGAAITLTPYSGTATAAQTWQSMPGVALQSLLYQPPQPFPLGASQDQSANQAAYEALMTAIWAPLNAPAGGLRAQYPNLAAPLASYQIMMNVLPAQSGTGFTTSNWQNVVQQLNFELAAVQGVRNLFAQLSGFHLALTEAESNLLLELAALCSIAPTTSVSFWSHISWTKIVEGLVYTALSAASLADGMGEAGGTVSKVAKVAAKGLPVIANLIQTGINGYSGSTPPSKAQQEIAEFSVVQQQILNATGQMGAALAQLEGMILGDWGKLKPFYEMICNTGDTNSLYWPPSLSPQLVGQLLPGFIVNTLQLLMPCSGNFKPDRWGYQTQGSTPPPQGLTPFESSGSNTVSKFLVYNSDATNGTVSFNSYNTYQITFGKKALAEYLWGSGAIPYNVFVGHDGWNLGYNEKNLSIACIVTLYNNTPNALTGVFDDAGDWPGADLPIGPYSVVSMVTVGSKVTPGFFGLNLYLQGTNTCIGGFTVSTKGDYTAGTIASGYSFTGDEYKNTTPYTCTVIVAES